MLDPRTLENARDEIAESCRRRGVRADIDDAVARYQRVAALRTELGEINRLRNEHQKSGKRKMEAAEREAHGAEGRELKEQVARIEADLEDEQGLLETAMRAIPNLLHPEVPAGGEDDARELRQVGRVPDFSFAPLDHVELGKRLDLVDFESATQVTGPKFYYLKNAAVLLELGLQRLAVDMLVEDGFTLYSTPDLAKADVLDGIGFNPRGPETQIYSIADSDLCLIGTAEITLGGIYAGQVLAEELLPIKMAGISHCFRTEAGSHGRESKGLYRVHQFTKVEMFAITRPEDSEAMHNHLLSLEERFFQALEVPYRVVDIAAGDLGAPAFRKYDLEAWMPGRGDSGGWGEVTSTSNCTDYQARRLGIRYRPTGQKRNEHVHMLNGTAVAISRALVALFENHQQSDHSIRVPAALQPYVGCERISAGHV